MAKKDKTGRNEWDLLPLFSGDGDPRIEREMQRVETESYRFIHKWKGRKDYLSEPRVLREALDEYERWRRACGFDGDAGYYFWLRTEQDQNSPGLKARLNKIEEFGRRIENDMQFFQLRIGKVPRRRQREFLAYRGLAPYRHFLERIFAEAKYLLSEPEERILNLKSSTSYSNWIKMTFGFLAREERRVLLEGGGAGARTLPEILSLLSSREKKVRDSAARTFNAILAGYADVAEAEINSVLANKKTDDELRKVSRPDLSRHIADDVESKVVDALVKTVSGKFDIPARFYRLKARLMGVRRLRYHERNVPYGKIGAKYPFAASRDLILRVLRNLDAGFSAIFEGFLANGQIDVYPRKGKAGGAFCAHHLMSQPTYILLNHTDELSDVLTLAHELGHGINNELIRKRQNALNFGTPTSTAEVASTFMEDFVLQEIIGKADDESRLAIMVKKLDDDVSTIFRQIACYLFESELHAEFRKKGYLSKDEIGRMFSRHMAAYMGEAVEQSKGSENWWVYWNHIRYFFYVYSYAGGLLISKSLQNSVKADPRFIVKVKDFLSAGLSDSPRNIFLRLGIDIGDAVFWERGLTEVDHLLRETESLARGLGKIR
ncbi:MAG: M3 family oligoendopeptidase [Nitrospiraceae bacterium]|nr:M3 family oligoendopeptidase [Nitrospiraceae bacterium]